MICTKTCPRANHFYEQRLWCSGGGRVYKSTDLGEYSRLGRLFPVSCICLTAKSRAPLGKFNGFHPGWGSPFKGTSNQFLYRDFPLNLTLNAKGDATHPSHRPDIQVCTSRQRTIAHCANNKKLTARNEWSRSVHSWLSGRRW